MPTAMECFIVTILHYLESNCKIKAVDVQYKYSKIYSMMIVKSIDGELEYMLCLPRGLHKSSLVSSPRKMAIGCLQKCL